MSKRDHHLPLRPAMPRLLAASLAATLALTVGWAGHASADLPPTGATYGFGNYGSGAGGTFVDSATGTATASYPIALPSARGASQPLLGLHYGHTGGLTEVGVGWSLGLPYIERRGLAGGPPLFVQRPT